MPFKEVLIPSTHYGIKTDIHVPRDEDSRRGVVLVHGMIINRKSLSRETQSLASYLCDQLNAYVIAPDYLGETIYTNPKTMSRFAEVVNLSVNHLCTEYGVEEVMGFGHSLGCYILSDVARMNPRITHISLYGGPTDHMLRNREKGFLNYLIKYLYSFDYKVDLKNLLHLVFDKETVRYLKNVMMVNPVYGGDQYDFNFDPEVLQDMVSILTNYIDDLRDWGRPVLMMLGEYDSLVVKTLKALPDGERLDNVFVKHVKRASHVTPCMDSMMNLKKLDPLLLFHRNVVKAAL